MAGLDPAIHVDARDKRGHDGGKRNNKKAGLSLLFVQDINLAELSTEFDPSEQRPPGPLKWKSYYFLAFFFFFFTVFFAFFAFLAFFAMTILVG